MAKGKKRETVFRIVKGPDGGYLVLDNQGRVVCPAVVRGDRKVHDMRAGNWRLLYMEYGVNETGEEHDEFWIKEEYAHRLPCW